MARQLSNLRRAPRFTGDQYGTGYQYEYPTPISPIVLGPWARVWPLGDRDVPDDALQELKNGVLIDGAIFPIWGLTQSTVASQKIVGAFSTYNINTHYRVVFYIDYADSDKLKVEVFDGSSTTTIDTLLTPGDTITVCAAAYQRYVYFGFDGATGLGKLDLVAGNYAAVASTPANVEFLFMLDNNLVAIYQSGDSFLVEWSVDSDPEDFAGSGSGQAVISGGLGRPQGWGAYKQDIVIICLSGAVQMSPTGSASPSFRFIPLDNVSGCPWTNAVVGTGAEIYYFTSNRRLFMYNGQEQEVGVGERTFEAIPSLAFSKRLNLITVSDKDTDETLFLDIYSHEWVSTYDTGWDWICDSPGDAELGYLLAYSNDSGTSAVEKYVFDLEPISYDVPEFSTGRKYLGREAWLDIVEVLRTSETAPQPPALRLRRQLGPGDLQDVDWGAESAPGVNAGGTVIKYHLSGPAKLFELSFANSFGAKMDGPFLLDDVNASGNVPVVETNPVDGYRADLNASGNGLINSTATNFYGDTFSTEGNLELEAAGEIWTKNVGIEKVIVYGKELQRGSPSPV